MKTSVLTKDPGITARPFLKWAGGKSQLLGYFEKLYPHGLENGEIDTYCEPFVGSGAVFLNIAQKYAAGIKKIYISDINPELIIIYKVIKQNIDSLITDLKKLTGSYNSLADDDKKDFYYDIRNNYNNNRDKINHAKYDDKWAIRAAQMIFLNKTCYNGLFRFNSMGEFNVPYGRYRNPGFFDENNLRKISEILNRTKTVIKAADFEKMGKYIGSNCFVYFDPPYRPISKTSSFTSYSPGNLNGTGRSGFDDEQQKRLAKFFTELSSRGARVMLSNSDPKNIDPDDNFFEKLYKSYYITRVKARRMINCNSEKRGPIDELVITNYMHQLTGKR